MLAGKPTAVTVRPAPTHPPSCVIEGNGVKGTVAGEPGIVHLYAKDRFGNLVPDDVVIDMVAEELRKPQCVHPRPHRG